MALAPAAALCHGSCPATLGFIKASRSGYPAVTLAWHFRYDNNARDQGASEIPKIVAVSRRGFLASAGAAGLVAASGLAMPFYSRAGTRPAFTHGVQSGDVYGGSGMIWARADRPSRVIGDLLRFIKNAGIDNTVWLTADVHYAAAHYYDPSRAAFQDFNPFWEFVSGPLHAGTFGPNELDMTFGPAVKFVKAPTAEQGANLPPSMGLQFFGLVDIDGDTEQMTVRLIDRNDNGLYAVTLDPVRS